MLHSFWFPQAGHAFAEILQEMGKLTLPSFSSSCEPAGPERERAEQQASSVTAGETNLRGFMPVLFDSSSIERFHTRASMSPVIRRAWMTGLLGEDLFQGYGRFELVEEGLVRW